MSNRCEFRNLSCPIRHTVNAGEKSAHQHKDHHKEKSNKHGLQLAVAESGDQQTKTQQRHQVNCRKEIKHRNASFWKNAIHDIHDNQPNR